MPMNQKVKEEMLPRLRQRYMGRGANDHVVQHFDLEQLPSMNHASL